MTKVSNALTVRCAKSTFSKKIKGNGKPQKLIYGKKHIETEPQNGAVFQLPRDRARIHFVARASILLLYMWK